MSTETARNIGIVALLGLGVWLLPGGGEGADLVMRTLNAIFIVLMAWGAALLYRRFRDDIYVLGDQWRLALYGAIGVAIVTLAASGRLFASGAGIVLWCALMAGASYTLYLVWQRHRSYT